MEPVNPNSQRPPSEAHQARQAERAEVKEIGKIVIRMWPKTPVLYPMAILALLCSLLGSLMGTSPELEALRTQYSATLQQEQDSAESSEAPATAMAEDQARDLESSVKELLSALAVDRVLGILFLFVFAFSLFTLCIDLEIRWALITFSASLVVVLTFILLNQWYGFLPGVLHRIASLSPMANPQFYFIIFLFWMILMLISLAVVRFHYVKIESNEVIIVGGLLERQQRFPTLRMQYVKDIEDVLEYYLPLVRSGRLVLTFPDQRESVVIPTVLNIDKIIARLDQVSGVLQVREK